jgi:IS1 family transposase
MNLNEDKALLALQLLVEGNSIRSTERITGTDRNTLMKLLVLAGEHCEKVMAKWVINVPVRDVEVDEIWNFIGKKQKRLRPEDDQNLGDSYTFVAIERNTKLVLNFALGKRDQATTDIFIEGLRHATASEHFQITSDGFAPYRARSARRSVIAWTSRNSLRFIAQRRKANAATLPPKSPARRWSQFSDDPIPTASARAS